MKWVRVSERLPEDDRYVLIFTPEFSFRTTYVSWYDEKKGWFKDFGNDCCWNGEPYFYEDGEVTHWAELPFPPKDSK